MIRKIPDWIDRYWQMNLSDRLSISMTMHRVIRELTILVLIVAMPLRNICDVAPDIFLGLIMSMPSRNIAITFSSDPGNLSVRNVVIFELELPIYNIPNKLDNGGMGSVCIKALVES